MDSTPRTDLGLTADAASCACCSPSAAQQPAAPAESSLETDYLVDGMTCSHCVASVTEELSGIDGVRSVAVDLSAGGTSRVTVGSDSALDVDRVRAAIDEAGYTLVSGQR